MTGHPFVVSGASVSHRDASLPELEAASYLDPPGRIGELARREPVAEAFVLQTCNRVEEYVVTERGGDGRDALSDFAPTVPDDAVVAMDHRESLRHLLRVAAGLESQVLGEDQILGQVRSAYATAREAGTIGPVLERGLLKAIHVGERVREETGINEGTVSLGSAAVDLATRERGLDGRTVLVVGAGDTATTVARALADREVGDLRIANRTVENAERLAEGLSVPARPVGLDTLPTHLGEADVVVTSTASEEPVIDPATTPGNADFLAIDLARPRDVAPGVLGLPGVTVRDLDALHAITDETHESRREAAAVVERIVEEELDRLLDRYKRKRADAVIAEMYRGAERIKQREVAEARAKLADGEADEEDVVEGLANAIVSQLMAVPTESLRDAAEEDDWETITTALELFDPTFDAEARRELLESVPGLAPEDLPDEASAGGDER